MARIRTIKPEFCTSEQIVECSTSARLLFVCMWCFCDDAGRHPASVRRLKMEVFPGDDFGLPDVQNMIDQLKTQRLLLEYEHDGERFWQVSGWKHQKIDRPNYKYGPLTSDGRPAKFDECSTSARRTVDDRSPPEGSLREGSLDNAANESPPLTKPQRNGNPPEFESWWESYPKNAKGRKRGKQTCLGLWKRIPADDRSDLMTATKHYATEETEFIRDPERFLKSDWWRDWIEPPDKSQPRQQLIEGIGIEAYNAGWDPEREDLGEFLKKHPEIEKNHGSTV